MLSRGVVPPERICSGIRISIISSPNCSTIPLVLCLAPLCAVTVAADWPQWGGPDRNGIAPTSPPLLSQFPEKGVAKLWTSEDILGGESGGWGSVAVSGGKAYVFVNRVKTASPTTRETQDSVYCLDAATGRAGAARHGKFVTGGQLAYTELARAKPDGYTISYASIEAISSMLLDPRRQVPFKRADFVPLAMHTMSPTMVVVRKDSPWNDVMIGRA